VTATDKCKPLVRTLH